MTHLGQRLSALIDGELDGSERERVLVHMARCGSCRDEVAALAHAQAADECAWARPAAGAGLTGRLMSLSELVGLDDPRVTAGMPAGRDDLAVARLTGPASAACASRRVARARAPRARRHGRMSRPDQRASRYFLAGSLAVFLAGLGTAAFIVGGEPQAQGAGAARYAIDRCAGLPAQHGERAAQLRSGVGKCAPAA